ncbi:MAG: hypothetical protein ACYS9X_14605 [Planctomycetota bacterium]|jgi:chromosome segregation ATPase
MIADMAIVFAVAVAVGVIVYLVLNKRSGGEGARANALKALAAATCLGALLAALYFTIEWQRKLSSERYRLEFGISDAEFTIRSRKGSAKLRQEYLASLEKDLEVNRTQLKDARQKAAALEKELPELKAQRASIVKKRDASGDGARHAAELERIDKQISDLEEQQGYMPDIITLWDRNIAFRLESIARTRKEISKAKKEAEEAEKKLQQMQKRLDEMPPTFIF